MVRLLDGEVCGACFSVSRQLQKQAQGSPSVPMMIATSYNA